MRHDTLSDALSAMKNSDRVGKDYVTIPASKIVKEVLLMLQKHEYVGEFELIEDGRGNRFKVQLFGKINDCGAIRPRSSIKSTEYERWERRFLPASNLGMLIISTSSGMLAYKEAKEKGIGGKLIAFIY